MYNQPATTRVRNSRANRFETSWADAAGWHAHTAGQFILVEAGISLLRTELGAWIIPTRRVGWVPPRLRHVSRSSGRGCGWAVHAPSALSKILPAHVCVFRASALLIAALDRIGRTSTSAPAELRRLLWRVVALEVREATPESLLVPMPSDPRLRGTAEALLASPNIDAPVERAAARSGMSTRSFTRVFRRETGLSFAMWRRAAIAHHSLERIAAGEKVSGVAFEAGYSSVSAFVAMMHRQLGAAPTQFLSEHPLEFRNVSG